MITLHHLNFSRSTRVLWLLEELGVEYELVTYERDQNLRAPASLARIHPLAKAPVISDGSLVIAESATILRYLHDRYGHGTLTPAPATDAHVIHEEWLDYVESSAALPVMITLLGKLTGGMSAGMEGFSQPELRRTLDHIAGGVARGPFLMGDRLTLADIQMSYLLAMAQWAASLDAHPALVAYFARLQSQPGFLKALARGGPMTPPG